MSLWDEANELESIANQISCLKNVLELVAERISSDPESGTIWLCADVCTNINERLHTRMDSLLQMSKKEKK